MLGAFLSICLHLDGSSSSFQLMIDGFLILLFLKVLIIKWWHSSPSHMNTVAYCSVDKVFMANSSFLKFLLLHFPQVFQKLFENNILIIELRFLVDDPDKAAFLGSFCDHHVVTSFVVITSWFRCFFCELPSLNHLSEGFPFWREWSRVLYHKFGTW